MLDFRRLEQIREAEAMNIEISSDTASNFTIDLDHTVDRERVQITLEEAQEMPVLSPLRARSEFWARFMAELRDGALENEFHGHDDERNSGNGFVSVHAVREARERVVAGMMRLSRFRQWADMTVLADERISILVMQERERLLREAQHAEANYNWHKRMIRCLKAVERDVGELPDVERLMKLLIHDLAILRIRSLVHDERPYRHQVVSATPNLVFVVEHVTHEHDHYTSTVAAPIHTHPPPHPYNSTTSWLNDAVASWQNTTDASETLNSILNESYMQVHLAQQLRQAWLQMAIRHTSCQSCRHRQAQTMTRKRTNTWILRGRKDMSVRLDL
jgi:hypothetical protein